MNIVIIGSGNVATVLGTKLTAAGHSILQIYYNSHLQQANTLAATLGTVLVNQFSQINLHADIYLLAVNDGALPAVAQALPNVAGIVVHTAGSVSITVLANTSNRYGVLYPLQSLRKEKINYDDIPLLIDGNTKETIEAVAIFAGTISSQVQQANDEYRLKLHTAAVVVSNFTNHLYTLAADYCRYEKVDFSLLQPLITETVDRLQDYDPADMQTGPAIRNDGATIATHLHLLQHYPQLQNMYTIFTDSIQQYKTEG